jgi:protein-tyrosine phosphatase
LTTRILPLPSACNFRDFGGYETRDGARVRWGRLYRSGAMAQLSPADLEAVRALGVRAVVDLRRADERAAAPNPVLGPDVVERSWTEQDDASPLGGRNLAGPIDRHAARAAMIGMYEDMPERMRTRLRGVFAGLRAAAGEPLVLHCMVGKDRTGLAAALVLSALGVPRERILEDYLLTNTAVDLVARIGGDGGSGFGLASSSRYLKLLPPDAQAAVLAAEPDYLLASFRVIEADYGGVDAYLSAALDVDAAARDALAAALLE